MTSLWVKTTGVHIVASWQVKTAGSAPHWAEVLDVKVIGRKDGQPDNSGNPPPLPWQDWPQAKRDAVVALLNNSDGLKLVN